MQQAAAAAHGDVQNAPGQHANGTLPSAAALPAAALPAAPPQQAPGTAQQPADPSQPSGSGQPVRRGSFMDLLVNADDDAGAVGCEGQAAVAAAVGRGSRTLDPTPPCTEGGGLFIAAAGMAQGIVLDVPRAAWPPLVLPLQLPEPQPATPAKAAPQRNLFGRTSSSSSLDTEGQAYGGGRSSSSSGGGAHGVMMLPQGHSQRQASLSPCPASPAQHVAFSPATTCPPAWYSPAPYGQPSGPPAPATVQHPAAAPPPTTPTRSSAGSPSPRSWGGAPYGHYYPHPYHGYLAYRHHNSWGGSSGHGPAAAPAADSHMQGGAPAAASPAVYTCGPGSHGGASSDCRIPPVPGSPYLQYSPAHSDVPSPAPAFHAAHHSQPPHVVSSRAGRPPLPPRSYGPDRSHSGAMAPVARTLQSPYARAAPAMPPYPRYCAPLPYGGGAPGGAPRPARAAAELPSASPQHDGYGYCQQQYHCQQQQAACLYYHPPQQQPQWPGSAPHWPAAQAPHPPLASSSRAPYGYRTASAAATGPAAAHHVGAGPVASLPPPATRHQLDVPNAAAPWKGASAAAGTGREAGHGFTFHAVTDTRRPGTPTLLPLQTPPLPLQQQQQQACVGVQQEALGQPAAAPPAACSVGLGDLALGLQSDGDDTFSLQQDIESSADTLALPVSDDDLNSLFPDSVLSDYESSGDEFILSL